jgi:hypothetical protein
MTINYLPPEYLGSPSAALVLIKPYKLGCDLLNLAIDPKLILQLSNQNVTPGALLKERVKLFFVGLALLIPIVNTIAILILRCLEKQDPSQNDKKITNAIVKPIVSDIIDLSLAKETKREKAAIKIQTIFRSKSLRKTFKKTVSAARTLQNFYKIVKTYKILKSAAIKIQRAFRKTHPRKPVTAAEIGLPKPAIISTVKQEQAEKEKDDNPQPGEGGEPFFMDLNPALTLAMTRAQQKLSKIEEDIANKNRLFSDSALRHRFDGQRALLKDLTQLKKQRIYLERIIPRLMKLRIGQVPLFDIRFFVKKIYKEHHI